MNKTIGIIGARSRDTNEDLDLCEREFLKHYDFGDTIVSGGCSRGGDRFAEVIAEKHKIPIKIHYADWDRHGKSAGFRRNGDIARDADVIIAVVKDKETPHDGGTGDTIRKAEALGKKIFLV